MKWKYASRWSERFARIASCKKRSDRFLPTDLEKPVECRFTPDSSRRLVNIHAHQEWNDRRGRFFQFPITQPSIAGGTGLQIENVLTTY